MDTAGAETKNQGFTLLIISISLATFMSALDGTIVNIALPTISQSFNVSTSAVSWIPTIYLLVMSGCVLIFGKVSDVIGFKRVFLVGFAVFTAGSFLCGLLPDLLNSFPVLIGSRAFQALGGAMITAIGPAMVTAFIPMSQKGKAMGIVLTFAGLGTAIGPTIGGGPDPVYLLALDLLYQCPRGDRGNPARGQGDPILRVTKMERRV